MTKLVPSEHEEQCTFVKILRRKYPNLLFWSTPNEGLRKLTTGKRLKDRGMLAGVPDLFFPELKLFIEMKRQRHSSVTDSQKHIMNQLNHLGYYAVVCKGCDAALETVERFITVQINN